MKGLGRNLKLPILSDEISCDVFIARIKLEAERLPFDLVISETATQAPSDSDQIVR